MEARLLLSLHAHASPWLDQLFVLSHELGTLRACAVLVLGAVAFHLVRGERRLALLWLLVGLSTFALQSGLKAAFDRPRPALWPRLLSSPRDPSFPSGHAVAAATFYPLAALLIGRRRPVWRGAAWGTAAGLALWIGLGRLYLGVHWPSDVLAGWVLGALQVALAARWLGSPGRPGAPA